MTMIESPRRLNILSAVAAEQASEQCGFCLVPEEGTTEYFRKLYGDLPHTLNIPGVPNSWIALQDVVPIAEMGAHILILPRVHRISLATVDDQQEIVAARDAAVNGIRKFFPNHPIFFFEHGPGFIEGEEVACGGCHLDHGHGHIQVMPTGTTLEPIQKRMESILAASRWENPQGRAMASDKMFTDISGAVGISPYLHIGMITEAGIQSYTYVQRSLAETVESQLLRRVVAEEVYKQSERSYWHWRDLTELPDFFPGRISQLQKDVAQFRTLTGF